MTILCRFDLFGMKQDIYAFDETGKTETRIIGESNIFDLAQKMTELAGQDEYKTNKYHLFGPNQYAEMIADQIKRLAITKYESNNIEVEIN